jgi:hypothetical protein
MFYQSGGIIRTSISQQAQMFINAHTQHLNQIYGVYHTGFMVVE